MEQMSLFDDREVYNPLASRLRPDDLDGFVGQEHLLGKGKLRQLIEQDKIPSMIFWGPPGVGKTTPGGNHSPKRTHAQFINFSAVTSGIKGNQGGHGPG